MEIISENKSLCIRDKQKNLDKNLNNLLMGKILEKET